MEYRQGYSSNFYNVKEISKNKNYKFIRLDINNRKKILQVLKKYKPTARKCGRSIDGPENFIKSNILGVFNLLQAFRKFNEINKTLFIFLLMKFMECFKRKIERR